MDKDQPDISVNALGVAQLSFMSLDIEHHLAQALIFRKDAWWLSFGSFDGYSESKTAQWLVNAKAKDINIYHLCYKGEIIGQLEYQDNVVTEDGRRAGYVFLFYLKQAWRGRGVGQLMHDFVIEKFARAKCKGAMLKYARGNAIAENFYLSNGWYKVGSAKANNLQLMRKDL